MQLSTDSIFHIGRPHLNNGVPCQDYALAGSLQDGAAYAMVADGCSGGDRTDVGARLICLATHQAIKRYWNSFGNLEMVNEVALGQELILANTKQVLGLTVRDLLATNLYAVAVPGMGAVIHLRGDGVLAMQQNNGSLSMTKIDWAKETPDYPAYIEDNYRGFITAHGGLDAPALTTSLWQGQPGALEAGETKTYTVEAGLQGLTFYLDAQQLADLRYISLFTDGVTRVAGVDWRDAVTQLLAFKACAGKFATRRMNGFLREIAKRGKGPEDDIGYAVIQLTHDIHDQPEV